MRTRNTSDSITLTGEKTNCSTAVHVKTHLHFKPQLSMTIERANVLVSTYSPSPKCHHWLAMLALHLPVTRHCKILPYLCLHRTPAAQPLGRRRAEHETLSIVGLLQIKSVVMSRGPSRYQTVFALSRDIPCCLDLDRVPNFEASRVTLASTSFHDGPPFADVRKHFDLRSILGQME